MVRLMSYATVLLTLLLATLLTACGGDANSSGSAAGPDEKSAPIKVGIIHDLSGVSATAGTQKMHGVMMAIDELNEAGGLLGRQIQAIQTDGQSEPQRYQQLSRQLILDEKVDMLIGACTSATREAVRPVVNQFKQLYIYNTMYEGGVADSYTFCTGVTAQAQWETLMPYMIEKYGPRFYMIAPDYNFGVISADWVNNVAKNNGGINVGQEFIPLTNSTYSATIMRIQKAKPDFVVSMIVGQTMAAFYAQWGASGMSERIPQASSVAMTGAYEHKTFSPPAIANLYVTGTFMEELDTPAAKDFVTRWKAKYPQDEYVGMEAEAEYTAVMLWAEAVKKAGTADQTAVIKAFNSGSIAYDAPSGKVSMDGKTHCTTRDVFLAYSDSKHNISFVKTWPGYAQDWLYTAKGIDLSDGKDIGYKPVMTP